MGTGDTGVTIAVKTQLSAFQNDIGDVIRLFYGEGAAVEAEQTADMRLTHTHSEQNGIWTEHVELNDGNGLVAEETLSAPVVCGGLEEKRQLKRLVKRCCYQLMKRVAGRRPAWGSRGARCRRTSG